MSDSHRSGRSTIIIIVVVMTHAAVFLQVGSPPADESTDISVGRTNNQKRQNASTILEVTVTESTKCHTKKHQMPTKLTTGEIISVGRKSDKVLFIQVTAERTHTRRLTTELPQLELTVC